jgi:hypothetical protein
VVLGEDWLLTALRSPFYLASCPSAPDDVMPPAVFEAEQWVQGSPQPELAALTPAEQRAWVGEVLAAVRACDNAALFRLDLTT